mmetsp:Transcript_41519/g.67386  ORF Transcript_41519/g.67386 Transcript_41519/m.67386 type:complete len:120 (-) Transcript_41519:225-584(-)
MAATSQVCECILRDLNYPHPHHLENGLPKSLKLRLSLIEWILGCISPRPSEFLPTAEDAESVRVKKLARLAFSIGVLPTEDASFIEDREQAQRRLMMSNSLEQLLNLHGFLALSQCKCR